MTNPTFYTSAEAGKILSEKGGMNSIQISNILFGRQKVTNRFITLLIQASTSDKPAKMKHRPRRRFASVSNHYTLNKPRYTGKEAADKAGLFLEKVLQQ